MTCINVASICPQMKPADPAANMENLARWARLAAEQGADLALVPETYISGYMSEVHDDWPDERKSEFLSLAPQTVPGPVTQQLEKLARELGLYICSGLIERDGEQFYITAVMVSPADGLMGRYRKVQVGQCEEWVAQPGCEYPVFNVAGVPTGIMICRDKSFPEIARILALEGAQLLLNPHSTIDTEAQRFVDWSLKICTVRAMENGCYLIANNNIADWPFHPDQHSGYNFAIDPYGRAIHCDTGPGDQEKMALIKVDTAIVDQRREMEGVHFNLWSRHPLAYHRLVSHDTPNCGR